MSRLIRQCEAALVVLHAPSGEVVFHNIGECPACAARGVSVVDDEGGRFRSCLVCGSSAVCVVQDA